MSCLPCTQAGETANISKEDFDRWTDNLRHVLDSPRARRKFSQFLEKRHLSEAEATLQFWEKCSRFLIDANSNKDTLLQPNKKNTITHMRFRKDASSIVEYAEDKINLDAGQIRTMHQALQEGNAQKIMEMVSKSMHAAAELLRDEYNLFKMMLLKEKGLISNTR